MNNRFFERPILNSPYGRPELHWELDPHGQPTQEIISNRRKAEFITPIPKPRKRKGKEQTELVFDEGKGLSSEAQQYDPTHLIVEIKGYRREDAKEKKLTMETYWVPGVNHNSQYGRWAFAEFTDVWQMQDDFAVKVEAEFNRMIDSVAVGSAVAVG